MLEVYPNCINFMAQGKITVGIDQYSSINGKNIIIKYYDVSKNSFTGLEHTGDTDDVGCSQRVINHNGRKIGRFKPHPFL